MATDRYADQFRSGLVSPFNERHEKMSPMRNLEGEVAVVTGGTFGVGSGIASVLAQYGARVFMTGRSAHDGLANDEQITGIRCDHRVDAEVTAAFEQIARETGRVDILVNNVWGGYERMVEDGTFTWTKPFWELALGRHVQRRRARPLPRKPARCKVHGRQPARADRQHLLLGGSEAHRECRLWGIEGRNGQDDGRYGS